MWRGDTPSGRAPVGLSHNSDPKNTPSEQQRNSKLVSCGEATRQVDTTPGAGNQIIRPRSLTTNVYPLPGTDKHYPPSKQTAANIGNTFCQHVQAVKGGTRGAIPACGKNSPPRRRVSRRNPKHQTNKRKPAVEPSACVRPFLFVRLSGD